MMQFYKPENTQKGIITGIHTQYKKKQKFKTGARQTLHENSGYWGISLGAEDKMGDPYRS